MRRCRCRAPPTARPQRCEPVPASASRETAHGSAGWLARRSGQVPDLLLGAPALRNIFDRGHPPTRFQRLGYDQDRSAVWNLFDLMRNFPELHIPNDGGAKFLHVAIKGSGLFAM